MKNKVDDKDEKGVFIFFSSSLIFLDVLEVEENENKERELVVISKKGLCDRCIENTQEEEDKEGFLPPPLFRGFKFKDNDQPSPLFWSAFPPPPLSSSVLPPPTAPSSLFILFSLASYLFFSFFAFQVLTNPPFSSPNNFKNILLFFFHPPSSVPLTPPRSSSPSSLFIPFPLFSFYSF